MWTCEKWGQKEKGSIFLFGDYNLVLCPSPVDQQKVTVIIPAGTGRDWGFFGLWKRKCTSLFSHNKFFYIELIHLMVTGREMISYCIICSLFQWLSSILHHSGRKHICMCRSPQNFLQINIELKYLILAFDIKSLFFMPRASRAML